MIFFNLYRLLETVSLFRNLPVWTHLNRFRCIQHDWHLAELKTEPEVWFTLRYWTWNRTCCSVQGGSGSNWSSGPNFSTTMYQFWINHMRSIQKPWLCSLNFDLNFTNFLIGNLKFEVEAQGYWSWGSSWAASWGQVRHLWNTLLWWLLVLLSYLSLPLCHCHDVIIISASTCSCWILCTTIMEKTNNIINIFFCSLFTNDYLQIGYVTYVYKTTTGVWDVNMSGASGTVFSSSFSY